MKKVIYIVFALCFTLSTTAQVSFQRLYDVVQDSTHLLSDGIATNGGGFATLGSNIEIVNQTGIVHRAIFTTYDSKGEIQIAKDIYLADSTRLLGTSELTQLDNGSYIISANLDENDLSNCIVALEGDSAEPIWSRRIADEFQLKISVNEMPNNEVVVGSTNLQEGLSIWLSRINGLDGNDIWAKEFIALDEDSNDVPADLFDLYVSTIDTSIIMTGQSVIAGTDIGFHTTKMDKEGNVEWSTHIQSPTVGLLLQPLGVTEATDTSVYVTGRIVFNDGINVINSLFVAKYDKEGEVSWIKDLNSANNTFSNGNDIVAFGDNLVISMLGTETGLATVSGLIEIDTAGAILNTQVYRDSMTLFNIAGGLSTTSDGGLALFTPRFVAPLALVTDIVKTGTDLTTPCSSPGEGVLEDVAFRTLSLGWFSTDFVDSDTLETDINNVRYYDVPTISPSPEQWCPNELIVDTLDATPSPLPEGVITYEWMGPGVDGAVTPFVVGMEEGEYTVMVTINDKHCYTLCDTVNISRLNEPTVTIVPNFSQFCEDQTINLISNINGVQPLESVLWSTGESEASIIVEEEGTYSLTIVDACMETAVGSTDVVFPEQLESLEVVTLNGEDCENFSATHTAVTNVDNNVETTYTWSNGANTRTIEVTDTATYTVTVSYCGISLEATGMAKLSIEDNDLQWPKVFFPRGEEEINRTFGPINLCNADVTNYTLKIYNRWGNEVFTSDDISSEWNGQHGGSDSATAVYVYVAEYILNGDPVIKKGDVTLLR